MASIVVEDGTGKTDSNSYISEADLTTYATDRGVTLSGDTAVLLIHGMDYIESQEFQGDKYSEAQALQWPRAGVVLYGYDVDADHIPQLLKDALCEVAISIDGGDNPLASEEREAESEQVGDIAVTYTKGARNYTYLKAAETKLSRLLRNGSRGLSAVAIRG